MAEGPGWYGPLTDTLSQGDIVEAVPWGLLDHPLMVCRPDHSDREAGTAKYAPASDTNKAFQKNELIHFRGLRANALVLWHDCQIDKFKSKAIPEEKWFASIVPIVPLQKGDGNAAARQAVEDGRNRRFFYMPASENSGVLEESYADLRYVLPVKQSILKKRVGTLSGQSRNALYSHLFLFLTSKHLGPSVCPVCKVALPALLPAVDDE